VSVRRRGAEKLGTRAELKNLNSFRFVEKAINHEVQRQIDILEGGGKVVQETRLYDSDKDETRSMRSKEEANDYRYFPDPDLLPVVLDQAFISALRAKLPELPDQKAERFASQYGLSAYDAQVLTASREMAAFYESVAAAVPSDAKLAANWVMGDYSAALNKDGLEVGASRLSAAQLGGLLLRIVDNTISGKLAKEVFEVMWADASDADVVIEARGLKQITDSGAIEKLIDEIIAANPKQLADYRSGKDKLFGFFVGQAMKQSGGKANPALLNDLLKKKLAP
jgi:aspartyl-tRNA(Asn)/glutamyl-tRNA(Gln) amidotransferase subunit B